MTSTTRRFIGDVSTHSLDGIVESELSSHRQQEQPLLRAWGPADAGTHAASDGWKRAAGLIRSGSRRSSLTGGSPPLLSAPESVLGCTQVAITPLPAHS